MGNTCRTLAPEEVTRLAHIPQCLVDDLAAFLAHLDHIIARADMYSLPPPVSQNISRDPTISQEVTASIAATVMAAVRMETQPRILPPLHLLRLYQISGIPNRRNFLISQNMMGIWIS